LVITSITQFSGSNPYPSAQAVIPTLGASLIILCGIASPKILVARILALKGMVIVGLVSYAWYLWHWPLLTFGRIFNFGERHLAFDFSMALIALLLAWTTYWFVERAVLNWRKNRDQRMKWKHCLLMAMACLPIGITSAYMASTFYRRMDPSFTETQMLEAPKGSKACDLHEVKNGSQCSDLAKGHKVGLLIGDSHAGAFYPKTQEKALENGAFVASMTSGACVSFLTEYTHIPDDKLKNNCYAGRKNAKQIIENREINPEFAILFSRWPLYLYDHKYRLKTILDRDNKDKISKQFVRAMRQTIGYLQNQGIQRILLIGPIPTFKTSIPECLRRTDKWYANKDEQCSLARSEVKGLDLM